MVAKGLFILGLCISYTVMLFWISAIVQTISFLTKKPIKIGLKRPLNGDKATFQFDMNGNNSDKAIEHRTPVMRVTSSKRTTSHVLQITATRTPKTMPAPR